MKTKGGRPIWGLNAQPQALITPLSLSLSVVKFYPLRLSVSLVAPHEPMHTKLVLKTLQDTSFVNSKRIQVSAISNLCVVSEQTDTQTNPPMALHKYVLDIVLG